MFLTKTVAICSLHDQIQSILLEKYNTYRLQSDGFVELELLPIRFFARQIERERSHNPSQTIESIDNLLQNEYHLLNTLRLPILNVTSYVSTEDIHRMKAMQYMGETEVWSIDLMKHLLHLKG